MGSNPSFTIGARKVARSLFLAFLLLLACQTFLTIGHLVFHWRMAAFTMLFDMDLEANLPMFFNSGLFFLLAAVCYVASRTDAAALRKGWTVLVVVFIFLAIDEGSQIHERFMLWSMRLISGDRAGEDLGLLHYAWVVPYGVAATALVLSILTRFLLGLPARTRAGLIIAGAIFVAGAVLMEMIGGTYARPLEGAATAVSLDILPCEVYPVGECNLYLSTGYVLAYMMEESLEMCGLIACIHAVMAHLQREGCTITMAIPKAGS